MQQTSRSHNSDLRASQKQNDSTMHLPSIYNKYSQKPSIFSNNPRLNSSKTAKLSNCNFATKQETFQAKMRQNIPLLTLEQYGSLSTSAIRQEFKQLRSELKNMSQKLNKLLSSKQMKQSVMSHSLSTAEISKSRFSNSSNFGAMPGDLFPQSKSGYYDKIQENNSKIKMIQSTELNKLLQIQTQILALNDPLELKSQLKRKIIEITEELKQEKKQNKKLLLESEQIGKNILNTDKLIQEMRLLQNQLNVLQLRKKKLEDQSEINNARRQAIKQGKAGIFQKQYELQDFQENQKNLERKKKIEIELRKEFLKKQKIIGALKKDKEARDKIKAKQYHDLLLQLNDIEKNDSELNKKYQSLVQGISAALQQYDQKRAESKFMNFRPKQKRNMLQIMNQNLSPKVESNHEKNDTKSSFYKSKRNLDMNQTDPKQVLKEIQENLLKTHQNIDVIEKKSSPQKVPQIQKIQKVAEDQRNSQVQIEIQQFRQNEDDDSFAFEVTEPPKSQPSKNMKDSSKNQFDPKRKSGPSNKKYQQLYDSQIIEQDEQYLDESSTVRKPITQDKYKDEPFEVIEQIGEVN